MKRVLLAVAILLTLVACERDADVASYNLSLEADSFRIDRRIIFYNGITDTYMFTIEGRCSIEDQSDIGEPQLEVVCKIGANEYKKHFLGLSDNVTYFVEQLETADVSVYNYEVVFKPSVLIPDVEVPVGESG